MPTFFGWREMKFLLGEFFTGRILHGEGRLQRVNVSGEILHWGNLPEFLHEILFISCILFPDSILHGEMLRVLVRGSFSPGLNCLGEISTDRGIFPWRWSQISWYYFKKTTRK